VLSRTVVLSTALFAGLVLATLLWVLTGNGADRRLALAQASLASDQGRFSPAATPDPSAMLRVLLGKPLFRVPTATDTSASTTIELQGLARSPDRTAALVSLGGAAPQWITVGQSVGEITLVQVGSDDALFDLPQGLKTVTLGAPATAGEQTASQKQSASFGSSSAGAPK